MILRCPSHRQSLRHRGFTLVELLVVIVIIVILASLAFMMTRKIRTKAYEANAVNSMRQVATHSTAFSVENNGSIHFLRDGGDPYVNWVTGSFWDVLKPYMAPDISVNSGKPLADELEKRLAGLFNSTDVKNMKGTLIVGSKIYKDQSGLPVPFAFNKFIRGKWKSANVPASEWFKKVQSFSDPAQILHFTYGSYSFDESDGKTYAPLPNMDPTGSSNIYWFSNRSAPAIFLDGHLEFVTPPVPDRRFQ